MSAKGRKPKTGDTGSEFYPTEAPIRTEFGDGWTLHLGNCLRGLPTLADKSVTVTITDPPYEQEAHEKGKRQGAGSGTGKWERGKVYQRTVDESFSFAPITEDERGAVAAQIARISMHRAAVFGQVEAVDAWRKAFDAAGMPYRRAIPWVKPDAMPSLHGRWPGQSCEVIVLAQFPSAPSCPVGGKSRYYEVTREQMPRGDRPHPTVKPLDLMLQLVLDFTESGDLVLDPFAGSGTTGVACLSLGRRFIGWELDETYFEVACRRLRGERAVPRPEQPDLFAGVAP